MIFLEEKFNNKMLVNAGITANLLKQQQRRRQQEAARNISRDEHEEEVIRARVRSYAFGEHLKKSSSSGKLVVVPNIASTDMNIVKGILVRASYGDEVAFDRVDWSAVQIFLLPDGEEIKSAGETINNAAACIIAAVGLTWWCEKSDGQTHMMELARAQCSFFDWISYFS